MVMEVAIRVCRETVQYGTLRLDDAEILQDATVDAEYDGDEVVFTVRISPRDVVDNRDADIDWDDSPDGGDIEIDDVEVS
jgi:hypothetical protein